MREHDGEDGPEPGPRDVRGAFDELRSEQIVLALVVGEEERDEELDVVGDDLAAPFVARLNGPPSTAQPDVHLCRRSVSTIFEQ